MQDQNWSDISDAYLKKGLSVIPVIGKAPPLDNWQRWCYELMDEPILHKNQTGIGLCLGSASDLICVDIDTDDKAILDIVPPSPVIRRGKKGEVRFFKYSKEINSRTFRHWSIEILSHGRQVVLPPSIHPETKKPYVWTQNSLLDFDLDLLPSLDLSFLSKLNEMIEPQQLATAGGRNNKLKDIVCAILTRNEPLEHAAKEIYEYDRDFHKPRLFTDPSEPWKAKDEAEAQLSATLFATQIFTSLLRGKVVQPILEVPSENHPPIDFKKFELMPYPKPEGALQDFINLVEESAYTDVPNMAFGSAIAIFSTLVGNRFVFEEVKANSFCLLLADSGTGKKFGISVARQLLNESKMIGSADYLSSSAIASSLTDYCIRLDVSDEFSKTLKIAKDGNVWQAAMLQDLCRLWSAGVDGFDLPILKKQEGDKEKPSRIISPYVSILSATTVSEFKESISKSAFTSGFIPRFLIFMDQPSEKIKTRLNIEKATEWRLICDKWVRHFEKVQMANDITGKISPVEMELHKDAENFYESQMRTYHINTLQESNDLVKPIIARCREHFKKLGMLHSLSRQDREFQITELDLKWAAEVISVSIHNASQFMQEAAAENRTHAEKEKVYAIIAKAGQIGQSELTRKTQFIADKNKRNNIIEDLIESGRIDTISDKKKTSSKSRIYFVCDKAR